MKTMNNELFMYNDSIYVYQWDKWCERIGHYFVVCRNLELARMQETKQAHIDCIVDDFGNLVRAA